MTSNKEGEATPVEGEGKESSLPAAGEKTTAKSEAEKPTATPTSSAEKSTGKVDAKASSSPEDVSGKMQMTRLGFISWAAVGWVTFTAGLLGFGTMILRFFAPNVLYEPVQQFRVGFPDEYSPDEVSIRWKSKYGIWIVHLRDKIVALSTTCTHLGCTPNWLANERKFKCPCHGSGFRSTGINFEGPAPRPLERFKIYLDDEGMLVVDKTRSFRQEKGAWEDPDSYVAV